MEHRAKPLLLTVTLFCAFLWMGCATPGAPDGGKLHQSLGRLLEEKEYFLFKEEFLKNEKRLTRQDSLRFREILYCLQGKSGPSNDAIAELLATADRQDTDLTYALLQEKLRNHQVAHQYADALAVSRELLRDHGERLTAEEKADIENAMKLWRCIADVPAPEAEKRGDASFAVKRDRAGLPNIEIELPSGKVDFVIDTGASYSVLQRSVAEEWGLPMMDIDFMVGTGTDRKLPCGIAVADRLELGSITLKHAVFLVIDDEALKFPSNGYEIKGALGCPEMRSLEEIRFRNKRTELFVPMVAREYTEENLMYESLTPLVLVKKGMDTLTFAFDTGADTTVLHPPFYKKYEREFAQTYSRGSIERGGAGGTMRVDGYPNVSVELAVGAAKGALTGVPLIIDEGVDFSHKQFYGLLGQDFFNLFDEMTISFKYSSLILR